MAKKSSKKKTQAGTATATTASASSAKADSKKADTKKATAKQSGKGGNAKGAKGNAGAKGANAKSSNANAKKKAKKPLPGWFAKIVAYFKSVRTEMKRVVWPSKKELIDYSIAVCVTLLVVGVAIGIIDAVVSGGLVLFSGLRG